MTKLQFMVGPPGTGKTSTFITNKYVRYESKGHQAVDMENFASYIISNNTNDICRAPAGALQISWVFYNRHRVHVTNCRRLQ